MADFFQVLFKSTSAQHFAELTSTTQEKEELKKKVTEMLNDLLRQPITGESANQAE